ncbi:polysaccharide lyase family 7 protein [Colwellia echini]|uniref:Polysaccharide lyase family 7 protein n=1 Tax=Colwellia echini TaxID=1982103 RepID=A0ABY3N0W2_9GAMM|nr:polysaccharide lyase family 7 protein [Colwellia echini]TYK67049.1 polysaccharide lyase family 7 protein [Colwellia echini]
MEFNKVLGSALLTTLVISGCGSDTTKTVDKENKVITEEIIIEETVELVPATKFDLSKWKITIPTDDNNDGKIDSVDNIAIQTYSHPDFFYLDDEGNMVFATPNKAFTTPNSSNTRSELHQVLGNANAAENDNDTNFALKSHENADEYAQIGGNLQATVKVNHVAKNAGYSTKPPAYSVVVGQIHATKNAETVAEGNGYGYGNEPLKIYYKKWPEHKYGSVFWNYERNLPKADPNRTDITFPVWGNVWTDPAAPGEAGIALDEEFSYEVNVYEDTMYLTFTTARHDPITYEINLANNVDPNGEVDELDHVNGYVGDAHFFKAGAYNQCSTKDAPGMWYAKCAGTGDWETDKKNGDYTQVTFTRLETGPSKTPTK